MRKMFIRRVRLLLLFLLFIPQLAVSQDDPWSANWVWSHADEPDNSWMVFRKQVTLSERPSSAIAKIAAENNYWLYVNGELVVKAGGLDTHPDLVNTYYDEMDLAPYLISGENIIAALVWYKGGEDGYTQRTADKGGFLFQADLTGAEPAQILTDETWKSAPHPAFLKSPGRFSYLYDVTGVVSFNNETFGDPAPGNDKNGYYKPKGSEEWILCADENETFELPSLSDVRYGVPGRQLQQWNDYKWVAWPVIYDARKEMPDWAGLGFDDGSFEQVVVKGVPPVAPWNALVHRTIPFWKDFGLSDYENKTSLPSVINSDTIVRADLDVNIQGNPYLRMDAPAGITIRMVLNEFYYQDYITKEGVQEFECLAWQNSSRHTVEYQFSNVTSSVKILDLKFRQTGYNTEIIGKFESNDEQLNTLWEKCKNTSYVCMRDIFYDCPNRERGQWWGDVSEQILYSFYLYDERSNLLARKGFRELFNTQKPDGSLYTTAPGDKFHLPDQNIAAVAMLWKYYLYTGDKSLIKEVFPKVRKYIAYCASTANEDGMLLVQPGQGWALWNWIDWGENKDVVEGSANAVVNASYIVLLENTIKLADMLEETDAVRWLGKLLKPVKQNFNPYFWNGTAYRFHSKGGVQSSLIDDRSNAWAVLAGMIDESKEKAVAEVLKSKYDASPYQEMYVELALSRLDAEAALDRMSSRFAAMTDSWSSTLWEEFPAKNSNNHAWSAGPLYHLSAFALGVRPTAPAYSEFVFEPQATGLDQISAVVPSVKGNIAASYAVEQNVYRQNLSSPDDTRAFVGIPKKALGKEKGIKEISINGEIAWKKGKPRNKLEGVSFHSSDGQYIRFMLGPGDWEITTIFD